MKKEHPSKITYTLIALSSAASLLLSSCLMGRERITAPVDASLLSWLEDQASYPAYDAVKNMKQANADHKSSKEASIRESERESSLEASIEASKIAASLDAEAAAASSLAASIEESRSVEASIEAASIAAESYAAVVSSVAESLAAGEAGGIPNGVMEKDKIVTVSDYAIPEIRRLFSDVVVLGNSRARCVLTLGILTDSNVVYKSAARMDEIDEIVTQAASLYKGKALFIMGINDLGYYTSNVQGWKAKYIEQINRFRSINPDAEIYLQEIIPIPEFFRYRWYNMDRVVDYNAALRTICEECSCTLVTATDFAFEEFISDDTGAHYDKRYHFYWAQTIANQMGLWGEDDE